MILKQSWHNLTQDEALKVLESGVAGLSAEEARVRSAKYGLNVLKAKKKPPIILAFLRQFLSPLVYVLLFAALIKFIVGGYLDGVVILCMLLLMAFIGFIQEAKAEKAMEALVQLASPKAKVKRSGDMMVLSAKNIVPGDMIILEAGDKVPADVRLINISNLKVNESSLTGESMPVDKHTDRLHEDVSIADRKNLVFMGTIVTYGRASAVVTSTGMQTEIGKIASSIQDIKPEQTPLQKSIQRLGNYIIILVLGACALLIVSGLIKGLSWMEIFLLAVAAAVSAIPEGLPAVVAVVLAVGMRLMAKRNAIIRRLVAVETLGSTTVICSDKTGTLTLNQMTVKRLYLNGQWIEVTGEGYSPEGKFYLGEKTIDPKDEKSLTLFLEIGVLCNDALLAGEKNCCNIVGDPTEGALLTLARKAGLRKEKQQMASPRIDEIPFQSEKQYMATLHSQGDSRRVYIKGSPEKLLSFSKYILKEGQAVPLEESALLSVVQANEIMAKQAMRVIAGGYVEVSKDTGKITEEDIRGKIVFVGLAGMADP
ncbi:HAD-IC family P-type ATPase, partial [Patescibacteria group bacterium]|nr:HAD-IC family P-type ATPase [Patescibacteria group bacterium]